MVEVFASRNIERIERVGEKKPAHIESKLKKLIERETQAKTMKSWLQAQLNLIRTRGEGLSAAEFILVWEDLIKKYDYFQESAAMVHLQGWKGESSIKIIQKPEHFIVVTFQKQDQDSSPKEITRDISKKEVNAVIIAINNMTALKKKVKTPMVAGEFCRVYGLSVNRMDQPLFNERGFIWEHMFADRYWHTELNYILRLLDYYGVIKYRGGWIEVIKQVTDIQTCLKKH